MLGFFKMGSLLLVVLSAIGSLAHADVDDDHAAGAAAADKQRQAVEAAVWTNKENTRSIKQLRQLASSQRGLCAKRELHADLASSGTGVGILDQFQQPNRQEIPLSALDPRSSYEVLFCKAVFRNGLACNINLFFVFHHRFEADCYDAQNRHKVFNR